ncbi:MAG: NHL repeat-containing protein [Candidatus Dormibacteria bacterium]|jgi:DNA-binding beta-propeller fold protein YncE
MTRHPSRQGRAIGLGLGVIALAGASGAGVIDSQAAFAAPTYDMTIGQPGTAFVYPWGMAYDPTTGTILTSDYNNYQVRRFTTAGAPDGVYSSRAALGGQQPYGVAVDPATGDFVVDALLGYLRYSPTGALLDTVSFAAEHAYYAPWIALSPTNEDVYVVQSTGLSAQGANEVLRFDKNDNFLGSFGTDGNNCNSADFGLIRGIDVDSAGNVYVNDVSNHCIQEFSPSGGFESSFTTKPRTSGNTRGLTVDRANNLVYLADAGNQDVEAYSIASGSFGKFEGIVGTPGTDCGGGGQLDGPRDTAVGPTGIVYVSDYTCFAIDAYNPLFNKSHPGGFLQQIPNPAIPPPAGGLNDAVGVAVSPDGSSVYVSDSFNQRIQEFQGPTGTTPGAFVQMWGSRQPVLASYCAMDYPRGVAVDPVTGDLWVNDTRSAYIKAYTPTGNGNGPLGCASPTSAPVSSDTEFGGQVQVGSCVSCSPGKFFYAKGIFVGGPSDDVYVPDSANARLQVLTQSGIELPGFPVACGTTVGNPAGFNGCTGVTADSTGTIYAASVNQGVVDVFSSSGKLLRTIGKGTLKQPFDTALSPDGSILYVTDVMNNRVSEFAPSTGALLGNFGVRGTANGDLDQPMGIAVDNAGRIYVNDYANDRIEVFAPAA